MRVGLLLWTVGNLYVFWRAWTVPFLKRRLPRWLLASGFGLLWGSYFAARGLEGVLPPAVVGPLELVGADWMAVLFWSAAGLLVVDIVTAGGFFFRRWAPTARGGALALAGVLAAIAVVQGTRAPVVRDYEVRLAGLPRDADGTVIVAISDLHLGTLIGERWLAARTSQIQQLNPDAIVVLGDVLEGDTPSESALLPGLRSLSAPLGVWAVNGNHEHYGRQGGGSGRLEEAGFRVLVNQWAEVRPGLVFAGVEDLTRHGRGQATVADPIGQALAGRPANAATVLLSHSPLQAERAARGGVALMLGAHTHDGQIWPFGYFTARNYPLMGGRYDVDGMPAIICRGTGTWGPRMRLWRPSEIVRITLRSPVREMAVTVDDLPAVTYGDSNPLAHQRITEGLLTTFRNQGIPAIGFVNEDKLEPGGRLDERRVALLRQWIDSGLELGNHTFSHPDLHVTPLAAFQEDALRGERVLREILTAAGRPLRYFRHPFLHTGRDSETKARFESFLAEHGYRVAPVTVDNSDYLFALAFARAVQRSDRESIRAIADEYVAYMIRVVAYYEQQSTALFGREIPQVLLIHASALNAGAFDALATALKNRGYRFVPLDRALADPAYASPDQYVGPSGITWIHRWAITAGRPRTSFAGEPEVPAWIQRAAERSPSTRTPARRPPFVPASPAASEPTRPSAREIAPASRHGSPR